LVYGGTATRILHGGPLPSQPAAVTSITQDGAATVSWQHPGDNGTASYTITPYIAGAAQTATTVAAPASSGNVTGLANDSSYTFTVKAGNAFGASAESAQSGANTPRVNQLFGDEFNGSFIDPAWAVLTRDSDQSNSELNYYLPANVSLDGNSNLVIVAKSQTVTRPGYNDANPPTYAGANVTRNYTSGAVQWASYSFTYGIARASMKVANGNNLWPAWWMLGANCEATTPLNPDNVSTCNWPNTGSEEIDIAEFRYSSPDSFNCAMFYGGGSFGPNTNTVSSGDTLYHTYEADWSAGSLVYKLDGTTVQSTTTGVPASPMFVILQTAVRGGTPTFTQPNLTVDWVRVFHN
jgi:beta-glucanase (GH16 family)